MWKSYRWQYGDINPEVADALWHKTICSSSKETKSFKNIKP